MMEALRLDPSPELIFGLVAPIGVDLDLVTDVLDQNLREMGYSARLFRLTELMKEVPVDVPIDDSRYVQFYRNRIAYANAVRRLLGDDALATMAVSAIRSFRLEERSRQRGSLVEGEGPSEALSGPDTEAEIPLPARAYIIRQLKRPEEISLLRGVYGRQFIVVSAYAPQETRRRRIEERERQSRGGLLLEAEAANLANELVVQDAREVTDRHGQNLRDAFPLGDVFIDATSRAHCEEELRRFIKLLFGNNEVTPTHDEYGMYMAKSASLRSSDLSRQVGAAIFRSSGEIISLGCNEVPKAGGGTYWAGEKRDGRDFVDGHDPNQLRKIELLVDLLDRLKVGKHLSDELLEKIDGNEIARALMAEKGESSISESKLMDIIEFGRIIHAEMSAITDAARKGVPIEGGTLYSTTFPCHLCAKHIISSGILRVVYLEPYPKSYASDLHRDSIAVDPDSATEKVKFEAFIGVSPYRYRDLFEKGKRKYSSGAAQKWNRDQRRPMIDIHFPSYFKAEALVVSQLRGKLEDALAATQRNDRNEK